ncbi:NAD-dependent epimerase/dehydratase family protein [Roseomonas sp. CCTCC AB2023176]|uniref:NAD-dependent epimerase/dehydratase family protein n=1 Tax=Roseomonas sp. CCTCC AB2023176 TaxID=3342640 RepID=UPI0035DD0988
MSETKMALVTGATGGVGGEVAEALLRHGWRVRGLARDPARARRNGPAGVEWVAGDAMDRAAVTAAAEGATVLFHGANPPGYRNWRGLAIPMLANAIAAAEAAGARLIFPGSVYPYGPDAGDVVAEDAPHHPRTRKGAIRAEMEAMLATGAARSLIVRAGDFFGPRAPSSWVTKLMMRDGKPVKSVQTPEVPGIVHAWAYLPDLAETIARLADREASLEPAARFHFGGHALQGRAMAEAVSRVLPGAPPVRAFPWWQVYVAAPFDTFCREVLEMRNLWTDSLRLDNTRLVALLGEEPHTPLPVALERSRAALDAGPARAAAPVATALA